MDKPEAILVLEDGREFRGRGVGAAGEAFGEVVFNTSMTGYQEIASDPSYCGQIITYTAPHIGNYGVCDTDNQSARPAAAGVVMRADSPCWSSHRAEGSFSDWLQRWGMVGICEVDTRALTRHIRERGAMRAGIWTRPPQDTDLVARVRQTPSMEGLDLTGRVTTRKAHAVAAEGAERHRIALVDFGVKRGILRSLARRGVTIDVLPATSTADEILERHPDGAVLSNGPGDPAAVECGIACARGLVGKLPLLGICLGHQILALALGGKTFKLPFGHHGGNHPVRVLGGNRPVVDRGQLVGEFASGEIWITAQNHGFAVDPASLADEDVEITHTSLYDGTLEGFRSRKRRLLAVQFHPEACPGPSDAASVFDRFIAMLERGSSHAPA